MSKIDANVMESFSDILPELVNNPTFLLYMNELPYQTMAMLNKQTLRILKPYSNEIVSINMAPSSYVDNAYFREKMLEDEENLNYINFPIKMVALKTGYLFTQNGYDFLKAILYSENLELFSCKTNIVIIEFLYKHYRRYIRKYRLPVYIFQLVIYFITILVTEDKISNYINLLSCFYTLVMLVLNTIYIGKTFFKQVWAYIDILYFIINSIISIGLIFPGSIEIHTLRVFMSVLSITIFSRLIHYMQLIDEIAPLVNIIILIFYEIGWFMVIFCVCIFAFANSFYLISQN
jgi:hypothetical protein